MEWSCERIFWELLPSLRRYMAQEMRRRGYKVTEIAQALHTTKSAVSQYLKGKRGGELENWMKEIANRYIDRGCIDLVDLISEIVHHPRFKGWKCG